MAGVGFALGAVISGGIGMLAGVCSGPGAAVTAGLGLFAGSITGAALTLALGASLTGLMIGGLSAWRLFTSTPLEQKLNDVVKKGQSLLTTPTTIDKEELDSGDIDVIDTSGSSDQYVSFLLSID